MPHSSAVEYSGGRAITTLNTDLALADKYDPSRQIQKLKL